MKNLIFYVSQKHNQTISTIKYVSEQGGNDRQHTGHTTHLTPSSQVVKRPRTVTDSQPPPGSPGGGHDYNKADEDSGWPHDAVLSHCVDTRGCGKKKEDHPDKSRTRSREREGSPGENPSKSAGCSHSPGPDARCHRCRPWRKRGAEAEGAGETLHLSGKYECEAGEVGEKYLSLAESSPSREHPRGAGPLEPLEKPVSVVLVKNTPYEGRRNLLLATGSRPPLCLHTQTRCVTL